MKDWQDLIRNRTVRVVAGLLLSVTGAVLIVIGVEMLTPSPVNSTPWGSVVFPGDFLNEVAGWFVVGLGSLHGVCGFVVAAIPVRGADA